MICIQTNYIRPSIPLRYFDWAAFPDGYQGGDPIGYGRTEEEAIKNLLELAEFLERGM